MKFLRSTDVRDLDFLSLHSVRSGDEVVPVKNLAKFLMHPNYIGKNWLFQHWPGLYFATILCTVKQMQISHTLEDILTAFFAKPGFELEFPSNITPAMAQMAKTSGASRFMYSSGYGYKFEDQFNYELGISIGDVITAFFAGVIHPRPPTPEAIVEARVFGRYG
jgi:hypothetical protein